MDASEFNAREVAILGAGREATAALAWLQRNATPARVRVLDERAPAKPARESLEALGATVSVGPFPETLGDADVLLRSPGVPLNHPVLQAARAEGRIVTTGSNLWFAAHPEARSIVVTGTKGKSTTSVLIARLLRADGLDVALAGNIGRPLLALPEARRDWVVAELSSYQLADLDARPTVGVLLNLSPEHLDWHGSERAYFDAKLRLVDLLGGRPLVANHADARLREALTGLSRIHWFNAAQGFAASEDGLSRDGTLVDCALPPSLAGRHNAGNVAAALTARAAAGIGGAFDASVITEFEGLPHRLQSLGSVDGRRVVNDSLATTPVATAAALAALSPSPTVVLVGGLDRGVSWAEFARACAARPPHAVVGMPDSGDRILAALEAAGCRPPGGLHRAATLADAARLGRTLTPEGGTLLMSPGAPSFPHFDDYRARGRAFGEALSLDCPEWDAWENEEGRGPTNRGVQ